MTTRTAGEECQLAAKTLSAFADPKQGAITAPFINSAMGIAIFKGDSGVAVVRLSTGDWSAPCAIICSSPAANIQPAQDSVLLFMSERSIFSLIGQSEFTLDRTHKFSAGPLHGSPADLDASVDVYAFVRYNNGFTPAELISQHMAGWSVKEDHSRHSRWHGRNATWFDVLTNKISVDRSSVGNALYLVLNLAASGNSSNSKNYANIQGWATGQIQSSIESISSYSSNQNQSSKDSSQIQPSIASPSAPRMSQKSSSQANQEKSSSRQANQEQLNIRQANQEQSYQDFDIQAMYDKQLKDQDSQRAARFDVQSTDKSQGYSQNQSNLLNYQNPSFGINQGFAHLDAQLNYMPYSSPQSNTTINSNSLGFEQMNNNNNQFHGQQQSNSIYNQLSLNSPGLAYQNINSSSDNQIHNNFAQINHAQSSNAHQNTVSNNQNINSSSGYLESNYDYTRQNQNQQSKNYQSFNGTDQSLAQNTFIQGNQNNQSQYNQFQSNVGNQINTNPYPSNNSNNNNYSYSNSNQDFRTAEDQYPRTNISQNHNVVDQLYLRNQQNSSNAPYRQG